jgi:phosphate transport system substrate-binding protein
MHRERGVRIVVRRSLLLALVASLPLVASARISTQTPPGWPKTKENSQPESPKVKVDGRLADYRRVDKLEGKIRSVGSSTLSNIMNRWAEAFKLLYPAIEVDITGGGSGIAIAALLENRTDLAPMSRPMTTKEMADFQAKFGYPPTRITVGLDAIAVYVNKNNPLEAMTLKQLDSVFSTSHKRGGDTIRTWGQLGLSGDWADLDIAPKGPAKTHGMYGLFREMVMENGEYRYDLKSEPVSTSIVQNVGAEKSAIGFASYFFHSRRTRPLALSTTDSGPYFQPSHENCLAGKYPLSRFLYVYINKKPSAALSPLAGHFLGFICSKQGQETAAKEGNYPLNAEISARDCFGNL